MLQSAWESIKEGLKIGLTICAAWLLVLGMLIALVAILPPAAPVMVAAA